MDYTGSPIHDKCVLLDTCILIEIQKSLKDHGRGFLHEFLSFFKERNSTIVIHSGILTEFYQGAGFKKGDEFLSRMSFTQEDIIPILPGDIDNILRITGVYKDNNIRDGKVPFIDLMNTAMLMRYGEGERLLLATKDFGDFPGEVHKYIGFCVPGATGSPDFFVLQSFNKKAFDEFEVKSSSRECLGLNPCAA